MLETVDRETIIRAWRDTEFRLGLTDVQRSLIPESPAGSVEISDGDTGIPREMIGWTVVMSFLNFCNATDTSAGTVSEC